MKPELSGVAARLRLEKSAALWSDPVLNFRLCAPRPGSPELRVALSNPPLSNTRRRLATRSPNRSVGCAQRSSRRYPQHPGDLGTPTETRDQTTLSAARLVWKKTRGNRSWVRGRSSAWRAAAEPCRTLTNGPVLRRQRSHAFKFSRCSPPQPVQRSATTITNTTVCLIEIKSRHAGCEQRRPSENRQMPLIPTFSATHRTSRDGRRPLRGFHHS